MTTSGGNPHMNAINIREVVPGAPKEGDPVPKMNGYLDAIEAQEAETRRADAGAPGSPQLEQSP